MLEQHKSVAAHGFALLMEITTHPHKRKEYIAEMLSDMNHQKRRYITQKKLKNTFASFVPRSCFLSYLASVSFFFPTRSSPQQVQHTEPPWPVRDEDKQ